MILGSAILLETVCILVRMLLCSPYQTRRSLIILSKVLHKQLVKDIEGHFRGIVLALHGFGTRIMPVSFQIFLNDDSRSGIKVINTK